MKKASQNDQLTIILPISVLLLIGVVLILLDREQIITVLSQADWSVIPLALLFATFSYLFICTSYIILARRMGILMSRLALGATFYVTTVMNHIIGSGGIAGFSVRAVIMKQYGVPVDNTLSSSFIHLYLASLDMLVMLPFGVAYLFATTPLPRGVSILLLILTIICALVALGSTLVVFSDPLRRWLADITSAVVNKLTHRWNIRYAADVGPWLQQFNQRMTDGTVILRKYPLASLTVIFLIFADWWCSVFALNFCMDAFGPPVKIGAIVAIYIIGIMAGLAATIPGGIGVQEGAMTGIGVMLGATFEQSILAAMLFRVLYYFLPYLISPLFYLRLLQRSGPEMVN